MKRLTALVFTILAVTGLLVMNAHAQDYTDVTAVTIEQAVFCTAVEDREPTGAAEAFPADVGRLYFWTELAVTALPAAVSHVWYYEDTKMLEVSLDAVYERTRTWSYKTILPDWVGTWHVDVVDADGNVLKRFSCTVGG